MPVSIVVGGQFGSEGKGKVALEIVRRDPAVAAVVRVGGPYGSRHGSKNLLIASTSRGSGRPFRSGGASRRSAYLSLSLRNILSLICPSAPRRGPQTTVVA
jgi:hypothetical protein